MQSVCSTEVFRRCNALQLPRNPVRVTIWTLGKSFRWVVRACWGNNCNNAIINSNYCGCRKIFASAISRPCSEPPPNRQLYFVVFWSSLILYAFSGICYCHLPFEIGIRLVYIIALIVLVTRFNKVRERNLILNNNCDLILNLNNNNVR